MALVVQKYGGSAVTDAQKIGAIADRIVRERREGKELAVVISALGGETDRLLALARQVAVHPSRREVDALLATGELSAAALLAIALEERGVPAVSLAGFQIPIRTDSNFGRAHIQTLPPQLLQSRLGEGRVVVVAGFQGVDGRGEITTLGRGGSDLTAVALAAALGATHCELYKDVAGIYTADPRVCPRARRVGRVSYEEMLELSTLGARVLQARSVLLAKRYTIPVHVLCAFEEGPGTWVREEDASMEGAVVTAITCDRKESKISVRHLPEGRTAASAIFASLAEEGILVDVIVQDLDPEGRANITFTVPREDFGRALDTVRRVACSSAEVTASERAAKVSAVGLGMRSRSGVAAKVFEALAREGIDLMAVSTSEIKISCVLDDRYAELAVRVLHDAFGLEKEPN